MASVDGGWQPGIGDPTALGWITVAAYFATAWLCWRRHRHDGRAFWLWLALALALFGLNKQLDLQSALTAAGRWLAQTQGWYESRHQVQVVFIAFVAVTGLALLALLLRLAWPLSISRALALTGLLFLAVFVLVRAASFHHVDLLLRSAPLGLRWNVILELGGIACTALGAWLDRPSGRAAGAPPQ